MVLFHISSFVFLKPPHSLMRRWPSSTLTASSALVILSSLSRDSPAYVSAASTGRLCDSPHGDLSSIPTIASFWPRHDPCTSTSTVHPPPLWLRRSAGTALAHRSPGPAAPYTCTGGLSAEAPSTWDAAEDGGSAAQVDAASNVSIAIIFLFHPPLPDSIAQVLNLHLSLPTDEHTSVHRRTHTECTPTTATDTTSTCHKLCLPTLVSPSKEQHGRYRAQHGWAVVRWRLNSCTVLINRELGLETVAPYAPSGHLHSHLPPYHPPPRLHHFPFMVRVQPRAHVHTLE